MFLRLVQILAVSVSCLFLVQCGDHAATSQTKIVGGKYVQKGKTLNKYLVALLDKNLRTFCTGTIISDSHILTAAHCIDGAEAYYIGFGVDFTDRKKLTPANIRKVTGRISHGEFKLSKAAFNGNADYLSVDRAFNDIAVVKFKGKLPAKYESVALGTKSEKLNKGEKVYFSGFGNSKLNGKDSGKLRYVASVFNLRVPNTAEIITGPVRGQGVCQGDSGGPLFVIRKIADRKKLVQVGVASRSNCVSTAYHTDITLYRDWINQAIDTLDSKN